MPWKNIIGQDEAVQQIRRSIMSGRIGGSYLFLGPQGSGLGNMAMEFARALLCQESVDDSCGRCDVCRQVENGVFIDLVNLHRDPESKSGDIVIDQVRAIIEAAATLPMKASRRVFIIHEAERLTLQAADCLLKTLEEPSPTSVFILYSSSPDSLPSTIPSRCLKVRLGLVPSERIAQALRERDGGLTEEKARLIAQMSGGRIERALALREGNVGALREQALTSLKEARARNTHEVIRWAQEFGGNRQAAREWIRLFLSILRDALLIHSGADSRLLSHSDCLESIRSLFAGCSPEHLIRFIEKAQESDSMLDGNVQPASAFENLFFALA